MNFILPGICCYNKKLSASGTLITKAENEKIELIMDGIFFDNETNRDDASFALEIYTKNGIKAIVERNGNFNIAILHKNSGNIEFISDVLATKPWYFYQKGSVFSVAPTPSFFAEKNLDMELNKNAVFETVLYNYTLSDHTLIKEISRNKPFHHFTLKENTVKPEKNYDIHIPEKKEYDTKEKMADRIFEIIDRNIKSVVNHKLLKNLEIQLPFTGGFDSRHILGTLLQSGNTPSLLRHIDIQKIDAEPVKVISEALGIPLKLKNISEIDHRLIIEQWLKRTAGLTNFHQNYLFDLMFDMPQKQMIGFDGYLMDSLMGIRPKFKLNKDFSPSDFILNMTYGSPSCHHELFKDYDKLMAKCRKNIKKRDEFLPGNNFEGGLIQQILCRSVNYTGAILPVTGDNYLNFAPGASINALNFAFNSSWETGMYNKARFLMLEKYMPEMDQHPSVYGIRYSELNKKTSNLSIYKTTRQENRIKFRHEGFLRNTGKIIPLITMGLFEPVKEGEHYWLRKIPPFKNLMEIFVDNCLIAKDGFIEEASLKKIWKKHHSGALNGWTLMNLFTVETAYRTLVKKEKTKIIINRYFEN